MPVSDDCDQPPTEAIRGHMRPRLRVSEVARLNLSQKDQTASSASVGQVTHLKDRAKIASLRIFAAVIDFRLRPHRLSAPLRSDVSWQQSRCFNDLQCLTSPASATAFDNRRRISLKAKYLALEGHLREGAFESGARAVPAGGTTHSAPGRLRGPARPAL